MKPKTTYRRHSDVLSGIFVTLILTWAAVLGSGNPATADTIVLPAGIACEEFDLRLEIIGSSLVKKDFVDKNGNVVRTLIAGRGPALVFTNVDTGATFSTRSDGSVTHTTVNPDGSLTVAATGHFVLILFPTDVPAGPSTTLYVGRIVYTIDSGGVFTLLEASGQSTDICAALD